MAPGNKSFEESQLLCFVCLLLFKFPRNAVFSAAINNIFQKISNCYHFNTKVVLSKENLLPLQGGAQHKRFVLTYYLLTQRQKYSPGTTKLY